LSNVNPFHDCVNIKRLSVASLALFNGGLRFADEPVQFLLIKTKLSNAVLGREVAWTTFKTLPKKLIERLDLVL